MGNLKPIKELFDFEKGQLQSSKNTEGDYTFITAAEEWKTHESFTHDCEALIFAAAASGSLGRTHYYKGKFIASDLCFVLTPKDKYKDLIDLKFYHTIFNDLKEDIVKKTSTGTSKVSINRTNFGAYEIPFFDKEHQETVRNKLENVNPIKTKLSSELQTQLGLINKLRSSILSDAVSGKLVPQDPNDESAEVLLEKIKAEKEKLIKEGKIKKQKPLPPINEDEIPYELPDGWVWCRVGEILNAFLGGYAYKSTSFKTEGKNQVLRLGNIRPNFIRLNEKAVFIDDKLALASADSKLQEGDILITMTGTRGKRDYCYTVKLENKHFLKNDLFLNQRVGCFRFSKNLNSDFLNLALKDDQLLDQVYSTATGSANQANIGATALKNWIVPLPPLEEQKRIVEKVEKLMATCDALELEVQNSKIETEKLMQSVLKEAFSALDTSNDQSKASKAFQRSVLAAYLVDNSLEDKHFGHVKLQKMLFMCEVANNLDFDSHYKRHAMGPYDPKLLRSVDLQLKRNKWFECEKMDGDKGRYIYSPLEKCDEYKKYLNRYFKFENIEKMFSLMKPMTTLQAEIVATLYSVYKDLKSMQQKISSQILINEARNNWHDRKKTIEVEKWERAIEWMKEKQLISYE